jgi:hypothetical protein
MKIRNGFVSNSSSSSFVVALPHKPETAEDLQEMMFGSQNVHFTDIYYGDKESNNEVSTNLIANEVFHNIDKEATDKEIFESIRDGHFDEFYSLPGVLNPNYSEMSQEEWKNIDWDKINKENDKRAKKIADGFKDCNKDKFIFVVSFSDNEGPFEAMLEHSDIFCRLQHIRTSYH